MQKFKIYSFFIQKTLDLQIKKIYTYLIPTYKGRIEGKMTNFGVTHLNNFWKIKDNCQEICSGLEFLCENAEATASEKQILKNDYNTVQNIINQITATGYFNKAKDVDNKAIVSMINEIASIEAKDKEITAKVWARSLSRLDNFDNNNFKLCVKAFFDEKITDNILKTKNGNFLQTNFISNLNITLKNNNHMYGDSIDNRLPYGFVYNVNENNFVAATDESGLLTIKNKSEITDKDYVAVANVGDDYLFLNGYATKLKTPGQITRKYSNNRFTQNDNSVVLSGDTKPAALFYYSLGIDKVDRRALTVIVLGQKLGLPVIAIDVENFYRNNGKFFTTSSNIRSSFNNMVEGFNEIIKNTCDFDMLAESKKLVGYNTMLRYNFVYKFLAALQNKLQQGAESMVEFVPKAFKKSVMKKNTQTKEREVANGAPLVFPGEDVSFAVPNGFLHQEK